MIAFHDACVYFIGYIADKRFYRWVSAVACDLAQLQTRVVLIIRLLLPIADSRILIVVELQYKHLLMWTDASCLLTARPVMVMQPAGCPDSQPAFFCTDHDLLCTDHDLLCVPIQLPALKIQRTALRSFVTKIC